MSRGSATLKDFILEPPPPEVASVRLPHWPAPALQLCFHPATKRSSAKETRQKLLNSRWLLEKWLLWNTSRRARFVSAWAYLNILLPLFSCWTLPQTRGAALSEPLISVSLLAKLRKPDYCCLPPRRSTKSSKTVRSFVCFGNSENFCRDGVRTMWLLWSRCSEDKADRDRRFGLTLSHMWFRPFFFFFPRPI